MNIRLTSNSTVTHISPAWSDHNILSLNYCVGQRPTGRGNWRFNPILLKNEKFCTELHPNLHTYGDLQTQWEKVKKVTKKLAKSFSCKYTVTGKMV
ncbi:hypothetical protein EDC94DRAFT_531534 [Helicostylum pulchrum]|nr:hypothetical protein EDC94DRAFT_531534 [Helicostylum pulchrum]